MSFSAEGKKHSVSLAAEGKKHSVSFSAEGKKVIPKKESEETDCFKKSANRLQVFENRKAGDGWPNNGDGLPNNSQETDCVKRFYAIRLRR